MIDMPPPRRTNPLIRVLAALIAVLAVAVAVVAVLVFTRHESTTASAPTPVTVRVTASTPPPTVTPTTASAPTATVETPTETPTGSTPIQGGPCYESEARSFGTADDGTSLVCTYMGADGGFVWVAHAGNDGSVHNLGEPCDPSVDQVAQDPSGKAIMCGGQVWVSGP